MKHHKQREKGALVSDNELARQLIDAEYLQLQGYNKARVIDSLKQELQQRGVLLS